MQDKEYLSVITDNIYQYHISLKQRVFSCDFVFVICLISNIVLVYIDSFSHFKIAQFKNKLSRWIYSVS